MLYVGGTQLLRGRGGRQQRGEGVGGEGAEEGRAVRQGAEQAYLGGALQGVELGKRRTHLALACFFRSGADKHL